jgi:hypothetical protein
MRRILLAGGGLLIVTVGILLFARFHSQAVAGQPSFTVSVPEVSVAEEPAADDSSIDIGVELPMEKRPNQLRDEYLELLRRKAELMTDEQILQSLRQLQTDIVELEAGRKLDRIAAQLRELIEAHPESIAAQRAQAMLSGLQAHPQVHDHQYYPGETSPTPVPDAGNAPFYHAPNKPVPNGGEPPRSSSLLKVRPIDETSVSSNRN